MVRTIHYKFNTRSNLTKLADDEFVTVPLVYMCNMAFKFGISNIGKITDNDIRVCNCRLNIYFFVISCNRIYCIRVRCLSISNIVTS